MGVRIWCTLLSRDPPLLLPFHFLLIPSPSRNSSAPPCPCLISPSHLQQQTQNDCKCKQYMFQCFTAAMFSLVLYMHTHAHMHHTKYFYANGRTLALLPKDAQMLAKLPRGRHNDCELAWGNVSLHALVIQTLLCCLSILELH